MFRPAVCNGPPGHAEGRSRTIFFSQADRWPLIMLDSSGNGWLRTMPGLRRIIRRLLKWISVG